MSTGRLTRQELGWLLAQEARGAAHALRAEVSELRRSVPPPTAVDDGDRPSTAGDPNLDALDSAISLLSNLQGGSDPIKRSRRGRVDIAALLYELAPSWRISIEPGAGTEVHGDEGDFRRIIQMLLAQTQGGTVQRPGTQRALNVRRKDDWVEISVELGPDATSSGELDRRWLSRMTLRYGGRLELHGSTQSVLLPAESSSREELEALRQELAQAQMLGETYARELAQVIELAPVEIPPSAAPPSAESTKRGAQQTLGLLAAVGRSLAADAERRSKPGGALMDRSVTEAITKQVSEIDVTELPELVHLGPLLDAVLSRYADLARRHGVELARAAPAPPSPPLRVARAAFSSLIGLLVEHAILSTPQGQQVVIRQRFADARSVIELEDGGPNIPSASVSRILDGSADPATLGRPRTVHLLAAGALAATLGTPLSFDTTAGLRTIVRLSILGAGS